MVKSMIKTEGIVLKGMKYQETSKILTIYTKGLGKISVMAKGANRPKSTLIANTQPFSYNEFQLTHGRNFYYISQADIIDSFYEIRENMERVSYGFYILELIDKSVPDEEANKKIFLLLEKTLRILAQTQNNYLKLVAAFGLKHISFLGYRPYINGCVVCGNNQGKGFKFSNTEGGIICDNCYTKDYSAKQMDKEVYQAMGDLLYTPLDELDKLDISEDVLTKFHQVLEDYILYNIERKDFNSLNFLKLNKANLD